MSMEKSAPSTRQYFWLLLTCKVAAWSAAYVREFPKTHGKMELRDYFGAENSETHAHKGVFMKFRKNM